MLRGMENPGPFTLPLGPFLPSSFHCTVALDDLRGPLQPWRFYDSVTLCHLQEVKRGRGHPVQAAGSWQHGSSTMGFPSQLCRVLFLQKLCQNLLKLTFSCPAEYEEKHFPSVSASKALQAFLHSSRNDPFLSSSPALQPLCLDYNQHLATSTHFRKPGDVSVFTSSSPPATFQEVTPTG